jgi:hypothetical protein
MAPGALLAIAAIRGSYSYSLRAPLTDKETVVVADFANTTGEPVFDGTLRQGLAIQLERSPFLSVTSDTGIQQLLGSKSMSPCHNVRGEAGDLTRILHCSTSAGNTWAECGVWSTTIGWIPGMSESWTASHSGHFRRVHSPIVNLGKLDTIIAVHDGDAMLMAQQLPRPSGRDRDLLRRELYRARLPYNPCRS